MSFFKRLLGTLGSSSDDPADSMRQLAVLLVIEIRLYNEVALEDTDEGPQLPDAIAGEVAQAYRTFTKRFGSSEEAVEIFVAEAADALAGGDPRLVLSALDTPAAGPEPIEPQ